MPWWHAELHLLSADRLRVSALLAAEVESTEDPPELRIAQLVWDNECPAGVAESAFSSSRGPRCAFRPRIQRL